MLQTLINKAGLSEIISGDTQLKVSTQGCKNTPLQTLFLHKSTRVSELKVLFVR